MKKKIVAKEPHQTGYRAAGFLLGGLLGYGVVRLAQDPMNTYRRNSKQQQKVIDATSKKIYGKTFQNITRLEQRRIFKYLNKKNKESKK